MKSLVKPIFVITILILSITTSGMSQENDTIPFRNIYKFGVGKLLVQQFFFGYERILSRHFSLNGQVGILGKII